MAHRNGPEQRLGRRRAVRLHAPALRSKGGLLFGRLEPAKHPASATPLCEQCGCVLQGGEAAEVLQKLLRNVLAAPDDAKYRRLRLSNRRIQQAVVDVSGGVELLQVRKP